MSFPPPWIGDASILFLSLLVQGIPFLLLGAAVGGVVMAWTPISLLLRSWPRHPVASAFAGAVFAFVIPACDCAVVPVVRRLVRKGFPLSAVLAYLLAAPVLNPICLISTYLAFRLGAPWQMLALRATGSLLCATVIGVLASRLQPAWILKSSVLLAESSPAVAQPWMTPAPGRGRSSTLAPAFAGALTDFLNVSTLYVVGAIIAAVLQCFLPIAAIQSAHAGLGIPAAMLLAFLLSLCSSADSFVVNGFGALGLAGQLAFLWLGPVCNLRVLFLYREVFQYKAIALLGLAIATLVGLLSFALVALKLS